MRSVLSRFNAASATSRIRSGRLSWPLVESPLSKPNLVAITTWSRNRRNRFTEEFFIRKRAISFGGIEERHAALIGRPDQSDGLLPLGRRAIAIAQAHATEADGGHFQTTSSQLALLHFSLPFDVSSLIRRKRA